MSAFAAVYDRCNTPVDPGVLQRVMGRLSHRGPDGCDVLVTECSALGHWHFWTTPEEVGERQPINLDGLPFKIVFDGRLDNRSELFNMLHIDPSQRSCLSDAALTLRSYAHWGEDCFEHFIGEYALVIIDEKRSALICARDSLGDRTLFYSYHGTCMVIASEPWAVAAAEDGTPDVYENTVAHYLAGRAPENGRTFFKNIYELQPAHALMATASKQNTWRYWQPDSSKELRGRTDEEYAEQFRSLLDESVRCRLRSTAPVGVLMSGGLDSTSVACLAARALAPQQLTTISMVFDELSDCDERQYIEEVKNLWGMRSIQIPCDDTWPYKDLQTWPQDLNRPEGSMYRLSKERVYKRANDEGLRVLLTGGFGDYLYVAGRDWLADFVLEGKLLKAGRELMFQIRRNGLRETRVLEHIRRVIRRWLELNFPSIRRLSRKRMTPNWLSQKSAELLGNEEFQFSPVFDRYATLLGMMGAWGCSGEIFNASRYNLELRHPYRDRRLIEFILSIPAYQLYKHGLYKHILRMAMQGILPDAIRLREQPTSLLSLFFRGFEREKVSLHAFLQSPDAKWQEFISKEWLIKQRNIVTILDNKSHLPSALWLCTSFQSWYNLLASPI